MQRFGNDHGGKLEKYWILKNGNYARSTGKHTMERTSIRGVEQVTGHHRDTVSRYYRLIGEHAGLLNEYDLHETPPVRTFVKKTL